MTAAGSGIFADGPGVLQQLVRLCPRMRRNVQGKRYALGALVRCLLGRQVARTPEHDRASAGADSVRRRAAPEGLFCPSGKSHRITRGRITSIIPARVEVDSPGY